MKKIAIFNFKGGRGKTTTVLNLGAILATSKRQAIAIDLDGQRTLSYGLGFDGQTPTTVDWLRGKPIEPVTTNVKHLFLIPADLALFQLQATSDLFTPALNTLQGFDLCLLDCPPGLGVVATQALLTCDRVLIPTLNEPAVLKGLSEAVQLIREERPDLPIDVVRCRYRGRLAVAKQADEMLQEASDELGYRLLETKIPENISIAEAIAAQKPVTEYAPRSTGAKAYKQLAKECLSIWGI